MKKIYKIITVSTIIIVAIVIGIVYFSTDAKDSLPKCTEYFGDNKDNKNSGALAVTMNKIGDNQYSITVVDSTAAKNNDIHFQIIGVSPSGEYPSEKFQSGSKTVTIYGTTSGGPDVETEQIVTATIKVTTSKCIGDKEKGAATFTARWGASREGMDGNDEEDLSDTSEGGEIEIGNNNPNTSASFDERLNFAKEHATKTYKKDGDKGISQLRTEINSETNTFSCDSNLKVESKNIKFDFDENLDNDTKYYLENNTKYLYATATEKIKVGEYKYYYYNWEKPAEKENINCKVECEEGVEVKYGPPVASKAGLCFEYKVRVESRVKCKPVKLNEYKKPGVCTPGPKCIAPDGSYVVHQGGPNESFDTCIKECDGGKYTEECSLECYNKIYNNSSNKYMSSNNIINAQLRLLANETEEEEEDIDELYPMNEDVWTKEASNYNSKNNGVSGYYYKSGNSIHWSPSSTKSLWHKKHSWGIAGHVYDVIQDGIPRTKVCNDYCYWKTGCLSKNQYLNKGNKEYDIERNKKALEIAKKKCESYVKCSTKTAEFTISADYKNESGEKEIVFPYETKVDVLSTCQSTPKTNTLDNNDTTLNSELIKKYENCYSGKEACGVSNYYLSEWSFPGSWINRKTGEISYKYKNTTDEPVWRDKKTKYCIPRDQLSVNTLWYQWYLHKVEGLSAINDDECLTDDEKNAIEKDNYDETIAKKENDNKGLKYNIKANTKQFGYFDWNIEMQCFYALYTNDKKGTTCGTGERTRTVDNKEIIPTTRKNTDGTEKVGFNWTAKAQLPAKSVTGNGGTSGTSGTSEDNYLVNPETVRTNISNKSDSIYIGQEYVDYEFNLDKTDLSKIKDYNKNLKLGEYCGESFLETDGYIDSSKEKITIVHYMSNLFRNSKLAKNCSSKNLKLTASILPKETTLKCNNIGKNKSTCGQD